MRASSVLQSAITVIHSFIMSGLCKSFYTNKWMTSLQQQPFIRCIWAGPHPFLRRLCNHNWQHLWVCSNTFICRPDKNVKMKLIHVVTSNCDRTPHRLTQLHCALPQSINLPLALLHQNPLSPPSSSSSQRVVWRAGICPVAFSLLEKQNRWHLQLHAIRSSNFISHPRTRWRAGRCLWACFCTLVSR